MSSSRAACTPGPPPIPGQHFVDRNSFIQSGELVASWHSEAVNFDKHKLQLDYRFSGESRSESLSRGESEAFSIQGWSFFEFFRSDLRHGSGHFINFHPKPVRREFTLQRLTDEVIAELQKKGFPLDSNIQVELRANSS